MADLSDDYGLIGGLAAGAQGFMKGMQDAEDRSFRRMEFAAKMKAAEAEQQNRKMNMLLEQRKAKVKPIFDDEGTLQGFQDDEEAIAKERDRKLELERPGLLMQGRSKGLIPQRYDDSERIRDWKKDPNFQDDDAYYKALRNEKLRTDIKRGQVPPDYVGKNVMIGRRAVQAHQVINKLEDDPNFDISGYKSFAQKNLPTWMGGVRSPQAKLQRAFEAAFIASVLRKESGAAITEEEYQTYKPIYFSDPGDPPNVVKAKRQSRETQINDFRQASGPYWREPQPIDIGGQMKKIDGAWYKKVKGGWQKVKK